MMGKIMKDSIQVKYSALENRPHYQSYNVLGYLNELLFAEYNYSAASSAIGRAYTAWNKIPNINEYRI